MTSLRKNISVIALACLMGATAFAGKEGHGGNAVVCRDQAGKIKSAELLDLFEGRVIYRLKIPVVTPADPASTSRHSQSHLGRE